MHCYSPFFGSAKLCLHSLTSEPKALSSRANASKEGKDEKWIKCVGQPQSEEPNPGICFFAFGMLSIASAHRHSSFLVEGAFQTSTTDAS